MDVRVDKKVALVTGGSRGIGEAIAAELLASGAGGVAITGRKQENLDEAAARLDAGDRLMTLAARADDPQQAAETVAAAVERFGSLDILVNNAGTSVATGHLGIVDLGGVEKTWKVNQLGPLLYAREAWQQWMGDNGGSIVNIASVAGLGPSPILGAYNISKAALIYMTRQLALEMAPRVRVNAIAPAVVKTVLARALWEGREAEVGATHPLGRLGEPEDIAAAAVFLVSDRASWITGVTLPVDGGVSQASSHQSLVG